MFFFDLFFNVVEEEVLCGVVFFVLAEGDEFVDAEGDAAFVCEGEAEDVDGFFPFEEWACECGDGDWGEAVFEVVDELHGVQVFFGVLAAHPVGHSRESVGFEGDGEGEVEEGGVEFECYLGVDGVDEGCVHVCYYGVVCVC